MAMSPHYPTQRHDPPKQGARRLRRQAPRMATPPGRLAPGDTWGRPAAWVGHRCWLSVSPEAGRTRFSGVAPGVASTHTKSHVKSEGGMGCTRVLPKSRVANPAVLGPAKSDLATKTNPEGPESNHRRLQVGKCVTHSKAFAAFGRRTTRRDSVPANKS